VAPVGRSPLRPAVALSQTRAFARSVHVRELSDAEALRRCRRDPDAICVLYDRHVARLIAAVALKCGDRETAFDIAQETFARTLERGHRVRLPPDGSAWPWLWTVAKNLLRDSQRRDRVDATARLRLRIATVPYDAHAIDELIARVDAQELHEILTGALGELSSDQRQAVLGRVAGEFAYEELAVDLKASEDAVRARVSRGLRALRLLLSGGRP
jgi:RNA polymerase sigma factor (sigma-70 family)